MAQGLFGEYEIVDKQVLASYGSFKKVRYWIKGWHSELAQYGQILFVFGLSGGEETELTRDEIYPVCTFEIKQARPPDLAGGDSAVYPIETANL